MPAAIVVDKVSKKFLIGSARYSSLRDVIARPVRRLFGRAAQSDTERTREFWALKDVSFEVEKGSTLGIIGPNGSGKSTMLKLISRVSMPTKGTITTHGRVSALIEVGAGFHPELTGRENVYLNGSILGMTKKEIDKKFDAIVDFSGIEQFIDTPVKHYSSGMYARLGFSVAAHVDPQILLVDEVLSVGDYGFQQRCFERMKEIVLGGATVVFVSHNLSAVSSLCARTILMNHGSAAHVGDTSEAISRYQEVASGISRWQDEGAPDQAGAPEVEMLSLEINDGNGSYMRTVPTGEAFEISLRAKFSVACQDPILVLAIRDLQGILVFRTDSKAVGVAIGSKAEGAVLGVKLRGRMNLLSGNYRLQVGITTGDHERSLRLSQHALTFTVPAYSRAIGCTNLAFEMVAFDA